MEGREVEGRIVVSRRDAMRLRSLLGSADLRAAQDRAHCADLEGELDRAIVVDEEALPADRVALGSVVLARDLDSNLCRIYTLVSPLQAEAAKGRISVLAPLGTALLGCGAGDEVEWRVPSGRVRLKIEAVRQEQSALETPVIA